MNKTALAVAALLAACNTDPPQVLPPPFGTASQGNQATRLFFPTGLASASDGTLLVANGNFNHAFDCGTLVSINRSFIDTVFNGPGGQKLECDVDTTIRNAACIQPIPQDSSAVLIGSYAGPMVVNDTGTAAYTGSRDSGVLNGVLV